MATLPTGKRLIIGLGTGRCGTVTLSRFLSAQQDVDVSHEGRTIKAPVALLPWERNRRSFEKVLARVYECGAGATYIGNVGFYWLNYVRWLMEDAGNRVRFICLQRDRAETVDSFLRRCYRRNRDHWTLDRHERGCQVSPLADKAFPKFPGTLKQALGCYWDQYYKIAAQLVAEFPDSFRIFPTSALNDQSEYSGILDWAQIPKEQRRTWKPRRFNSCPAWGNLKKR